jgi:hypothetical protein
MDDGALRWMDSRLAPVAEELGGGRSRKWRCPAVLHAQIVVQCGAST